MRIELAAQLRTSDGGNAGTIERVIIDPLTKDVAAFVIATGGLLGREVLVQRDELGDKTPDGAIRLSVAKADLDRRADFEPTAFAAPPSDWTIPADYPAAALLSPLGPAQAIPPPPAVQPRIDRGAPIVDRDGKDVGVAEDVRFAAADGALAGLTIRAGGLVETAVGGGAEREIPAAEIASVTGGSVKLKITKRELERRLDATERARHEV